MIQERLGQEWVKLSRRVALKTVSSSLRSFRTPNVRNGPAADICEALVPASSRVLSAEDAFVLRLIAPWQVQHAAIIERHIRYWNWFHPQNGVG
jgi:hypothetical protein